MGAGQLGKFEYLKRRRGKGRSGDIWYVRVQVPRELISYFGKKWIEKSLKTTSHREAMVLRHAPLAEIFKSFELAETRAISSADIQHHAMEYLRARLSQVIAGGAEQFQPTRIRLDRTLPSSNELAEFQLYENLEECFWPPTIEKEARRVASMYGVTWDEAPKDEICAAFLRAEIQAVARSRASHNGQYLGQVPILNPRAVDPISGEIIAPTRPIRDQRSEPRFSDIASKYIADRNREGRTAWTNQTRRQAEATLRLFSEYTRDIAIASISRADVARFLSALAGLDPKYGQQKSGRELTFNDLLTHFSAHSGAGLTQKTLNRHVGAIAAVFDWASRAGQFDGPNPAKGHHRSSTNNGGAVDDKRRPFTVAEVQKLVDGSIFQVPNNERIRPLVHSVSTALPWLVLIALFSGMRLDEICGLRIADIAEDSGIGYFDVRSHADRRLKTAAAERRIPIHSELNILGFLEYIGHVKDAGHEYIFPGLKPGGPDRKRSWYAGKRFIVYRRSVGVSAKATVFHSFRKNVATSLERAQIPENEAVQVMGHEKMTMSYGLYSAGVGLDRLTDVVEAIRYPGLNLDTLRN